MYLDRLFVDLPHDQVRLLLLALSRRLTGSLTSAQVEQFCADLALLEPDDDILIEPSVRLAGEELPLVIDVFRDDRDTLELVFMLPAVLAGVVQEEIRAVCGEVPVRVIPGPTSESE